jgi:hypothetical protein
LGVERNEAGVVRIALYSNATCGSPLLKYVNPALDADGQFLTTVNRPYIEPTLEPGAQRSDLNVVFVDDPMIISVYVNGIQSAYELATC